MEPKKTLRKGPVALLKSLVRRVLHALRDGFAWSMRRCVPLLERVAPPLGRRMRGWGWIWQPTYGHRWLENFYEKTVDPYHFDGTPYEAGKYSHTMQLLEGRTYGAALEIGAAEGVFTQQLASVCSSLLAIEVAEAAVARARKRLADCPNVEFVQAALPGQMPEGRFDLVVASDVLYYFPKDVLLGLLERFGAALEPGGVLFALHYLGDFGQPLLGREVHDLMKGHLSSLELIHEETKEGVGPGGEGYAVSIFRMPGAVD